MDNAASDDGPVHDAGSRDKLWDLIKDLKFAMFTTRHENGHLHARPMTTQNRDEDEDDSAWFFMPKDGGTLHDLRVDPQVNLAYVDGKDTFVSVSGMAEVVDDPARKRALWGPQNEAWFPEGPDGPNVGLVRVRISHADYWDVKSNKLVQLYAMAKTAVTGHPPSGEVGEQGHVRMH